MHPVLHVPQVRADITTDHDILKRATRSNEVSIWNTEVLFHVTENFLRLRSLETRYYISMMTATSTAKRKINTGEKYIPPACNILTSRSRSFCLYCSESHTSPYQKPLLGDMVGLWRQMRQFNLGTIGVSLFPDTVGKAVTHSYHHSYFNILTDEKIFKCISYGNKSIHCTLL